MMRNDVILAGSGLIILTVAAIRMRSRIFGLLRRASADPLTLDQVANRLAKEPQLVAGLVSHRGFHYPSDKLQRPLENTLAAYERSWSAGVRFCECDVAQTKDGEIILCHDANLKRLALHPTSVTAAKDVTECSFEGQLENFPLKDGSRVPKLSEVLLAAKRVGNGSKLVIEIKGEDKPCATAVSELLKGELGKYVAVVMGFSLGSVKTFASANSKRGEVLSMLLTVRKKDSKTNQYFDLDMIAPVLDVIRSNGIDGLYLQYDPTFLEDPRFHELCKQIPIGVWGRNILDPDHKEVANRLLSRGARFVNTDFPDDFFS